MKAHAGMARSLLAWRRTVTRLAPEEREALGRRPTVPARSEPRVRPLRFGADRRSVSLLVETEAGEWAELECWLLVLAPWAGDDGCGILFRGLQAPGALACGALRVPGRGVRVWSRSTAVAMLAAASRGPSDYMRAELMLGDVRRLAQALEAGVRVRAPPPLAPPRDPPRWPEG